MIKFNTMNDTHIRYILDNKDIEVDIINSFENVLVVFTQTWCSDWKDMDKDLMENHATDEIDINVYTLEYNKSLLFEPFREFKENVWNSHLIPYLRYYKNGVLLWETNHLPFTDIVNRFNTD